MERRARGWLAEFSLARLVRATTACGLAASLLIGCGGTPPRTDTAIPDRGVTGAGWLVWSDAQGTMQTTWLDASGSPRATRSGAVIAVGHALFALEVTEARPRLPTCDQLEANDGDPPAGEEARLERADLVELGGSRRVSLAVPAEHASASETRQTITLRASLGPYVFVESAVDAFACGAHGNREVEAVVVDALEGEPIELAMLETAGQDVARARARNALLADEAAELEGDPELDDIRLVESVPVFAASGIAMEDVFVADVCYACSDGRWSAYTRATIVVDDTLPSVLAPFASMPAAVMRWITSHPSARGVSVVAAEDADRLGSLFGG